MREKNKAILFSGSGGCFGSIPQLAYSYIQLFGLATEADYGYISGVYGTTESCDFDPAVTKPYATLRGFESLPKNDLVGTFADDLCP